MSNNEIKWFILFLVGMALIGAERGWQGITWNVGIGIVGWMIGKVLRDDKHK